MLHTLQWLYTYIVKVGYQCFICVFGRMLQVCLSGCCICFTHMLQLFYLDVAYVCNIFSSVSEACFKCFICLLLYVAVLYLNVSKVDRVSTANLYLVGVD